MEILANNDRSILRELAKQQADAANSLIMKSRAEDWTKLNNLQKAPPMIHFETWTFEQDLLTPLLCEGNTARSMELQMRRDMLNHTCVGDDRVVPATFGIGYQTWFHLFDMTLNIDHAVDSQGRNLGHRFNHLINDLETDLPHLRPSTFGVDRMATTARRIFAEEAFGDILPVHMSLGSPAVCLTQDLVHYMGMEPMFYAMMDTPVEFHTLMRKMTDDHIRYLNWLENENLLLLNNGSNGVGNGTFGFTTDLPGADWTADKPVKLQNIWGFMDSQETVGISPDAFHEFFFPYYKEAGDHFGLLSYGCCEPVHSIWDNCLQYLTNLRKVSISPWCDEVFMGEVLRKQPVIYHRKPSPNYVGVGETMDETGLMDHYKKTLQCAAGCHLEFSFRDVYTTGGDPEKPRRAVQLLRQAIEQYWQG